MSAKDDTAARRPTKDRAAKSGGKRGESRDDAGKQPPGELGRALKTVYDDTLREEVPKDFLDLLGKLS